MNLFSDIRQHVLTALSQMAKAGQLPEDLPLDQITVEPPRDPAHGEMTTNAAMALASIAGRPARAIAEDLGHALAGQGGVEQADVAGPGFLNLRLATTRWHDVARAAHSAKEVFGQTDLGAGRSVNVEFVSANPTGPLQVAHLRGAIYGDALARLLSFTGHRVTREYYVNDGGAQGDVLARSVYLRYIEAHGSAVDFPEGTIPADNLRPLGVALKDKVGTAYLDQPEHVWLSDVRAFSLEQMMAIIREDLAALGIDMDVFFFESDLLSSGRIDAALAGLEARGLIYEGVLEPAGGKAQPGWQPRSQTLFRSTTHGDDQDRPVRKSDGSWAYFAPDIAYHYDKLQRGFDAIVDVLGADHGGYVKRLRAVVSALSGGQVPIDVKLLHLTRLSPRSMETDGNRTLRELVSEVGPDLLRLAVLARRNDAPLVLDPDSIRAQTRENATFWVQYAHVQAVQMQGAALSEEGGDLLSDPASMALLRKVAEWPAVVARAAETREPQRIALYLVALADEFERWRQHIRKQDNAQASAKSDLAGAVAIVIAAGLGILGIEPALEMR